MMQSQPHLHTNWTRPTINNNSKHYIPPCRGSIPPKKRHRYLFSEGTAPSTTPTIMALNHHNHSIQKVVVEQSIGSNNDNNKISALALVAAAAARSNPIVTPDNSSSSSSILPTSYSLPSTCVSTGTSSNLRNSSTTVSNKSLTEVQSSPRHSRLPLTSPIPGGCHGRTSRNNSFCRRLPCYNGSNYCKLHYTQYVPKGDENNNTSPTTDSALVPPNTNTVVSSANSSSTSNARCVVTNTSRHYPHADKRYTGLVASESPCKATTTRRRPCAYVAVNGTHYCHLHADYDTNPPPRRGGARYNNNNNKHNNNAANASLLFLLRKGNNNSITPEASNATIANNSTITTNSTSFPNNNSNTITAASTTNHIVSLGNDNSANRNQLLMSQTNSTRITGSTATQNNHNLSKPSSFLSNNNYNDLSNTNNNTYPLLNSIPSDQWANQHVMIATGPLMNQTGHVVKWGNGWVTVKIITTRTSNENIPNTQPDCELLHNRRAMELYILPPPPTSSTPAAAATTVVASADPAPSILMINNYHNNPQPFHRSVVIGQYVED